MKNEIKTTRNSKLIKPWIGSFLPNRKHFAVGPCPICGRLDTWINDVPLKAFCWGLKHKEHKEWSKTIPNKYNNYLKGFIPNCPVREISFLDKRSAKLKKISPKPKSGTWESFWKKA
jgi:hypothetical protein